MEKIPASGPKPDLLDNHTSSHTFFHPLDTYEWKESSYANILFNKELKSHPSIHPSLGEGLRKEKRWRDKFV
jgi:hypothetical protein